MTETTTAPEQMTESPAEYEPLTWKKDEDGDWFARNTAGIGYEGCEGEDTPAIFIVTLDEDAPVLVDVAEFDNVDTPDPFATLDEAKVWCERKNRELWEKATTAPADEHEFLPDEPAPPREIIAEAERPQPAPAPDPAPPPAKASLSLAETTGPTWDAETVQGIVEARTVEAELEQEYAAKWAEVKEVKKKLDAASSALGRLIDSARSQFDAPLFNLPKASPAQSPPAPIVAAAPPESSGGNAPDAWRAAVIADLRTAGGKPMTPGKLKALASVDPPIVTLGDLADYQAKAGEWWCWRNLKGFGETGQDQLAAVSDAYWATHPQPKSPEGVAPGRNATSSEFSEPREYENTQDSSGGQPVALAQASSTVGNDVERIENVIDVTNEEGWSIKIDVLLDAEGWHYSRSVKCGARDMPETGEKPAFSEKASAIAAACDEIDGWMKLLAKSAARYIKPIRRELSAIDKRFSDEPR